MGESEDIIAALEAAGGSPQLVAAMRTSERWRALAETTAGELAAARADLARVEAERDDLLAALEEKRAHDPTWDKLDAMAKGVLEIGDAVVQSERDHALDTAQRCFETGWRAVVARDAAIELCEEMIGYVPDYFRERWGHDEELARIKADAAGDARQTKKEGGQDE